jgi:hypothetical protein
MICSILNPELQYSIVKLGSRDDQYSGVGGLITFAKQGTFESFPQFLVSNRSIAIELSSYGFQELAFLLETRAGALSRAASMVSDGIRIKSSPEIRKQTELQLAKAICLWDASRLEALESLSSVAIHRSRAICSALDLGTSKSSSTRLGKFVYEAESSLEVAAIRKLHAISFEIASHLRKAGSRALAAKIQTQCRIAIHFGHILNQASKSAPNNPETILAKRSKFLSEVGNLDSLLREIFDNKSSDEPDLNNEDMLKGTLGLIINFYIFLSAKSDSTFQFYVQRSIDASHSVIVNPLWSSLLLMKQRNTFFPFFGSQMNWRILSEDGIFMSKRNIFQILLSMYWSSKIQSSTDKFTRVNTRCNQQKCLFLKL